MHNKSINYIVIGFLLMVMLFPVTQSQSYEKDLPWWDDSWSYRQEIHLPFSTDKDLAKYQPVDLKINFEDDCWTKNERETSVRVCYYNDQGWHEIESQIYNLEFNHNNEYLKTCNVVFLITGEANGKESYFIYYDESIKEPASYPDHVGLEELYFYHEPIPGIVAESTFYAINEEGYYIYYVAQEGNLLGQWISQGVVKLEKNTAEIRSDSAGQLAQFCFSYYKGSKDEDQISTGEKLVSKKIRCDGNLMVEFSIVSESTEKNIRTMNIYKYYYSPTEYKRMRIHAKHETLKELIVGYEVDYWDGSYASIMSFNSRSSTLKNMNFGEILPYLHVYEDDDQIREYKVNQNPNYKEPKIFLSAKDDIKLGAKAWISNDNKNGPTNAIILSTNENIVKTGDGEKDGVQVRGFESEYVNIPGLEADIAMIHLTRNSYQNGEYDRLIPEGFIAEFDAEFFTTETNGYGIVEKEAEFFQSSIKYSSSYYDLTNGDDSVERFNLTVYTHNAYSFPLGTFLSILSGRNLTYISAELYKNGVQVSTGTAGRIKVKMDADVDFEGKKIFEKIRMIFDLLDKRNITIFKTIDFFNLPKGNYVVKIYKEKPGKEEREFIGFKTIFLKEETKTHVFCKKQGTLEFSVVDQDKKGVENAHASVFVDGFCIAEGVTDENGEMKINLPCFSSDYNAKIVYNGFNIYNETFKLKCLRRFVPVKIALAVDLYDFGFKIVDLFGLPAGIELKPYLTSDGMEEETVLHALELDNGEFVFRNLYPAKYKLIVVYKSFKVEEDVSIPNNPDDLKIVFPAEYNLKIITYDSIGSSLENALVTVERNGIQIEEKTNKNGAAVFVLPPGSYKITTNNIEKTIMVTGNEHIELVTKETPLLFSLITVFSLLIIVFMLVLVFLKKITWGLFLKALVVAFLLLAITMPWWNLHGITEDSDVETNVKTYPWSQKVVSTTIYEREEYREISTIPEDLFTVFLQTVLMFTIIAAVAVILNIFLHVTKKQRLVKISLYFIIVLLIVLIGLFVVGMNQFCEVGVGGVYGSGDISVNIPGSAEYVHVPSSWGMDTGFYLSVVSCIILIALALFFNKKNKCLNKLLRKK